MLNGFFKLLFTRFFSIYLLISALAFIIDYTSVLAAAKVTHLPNHITLAFGFIIGSITHYLLSLTFIFDSDVKKSKNLAFYFLTSLLHLIVLYLITLVLINFLNVDILTGKLIAAFSGILIIYITRIKVFGLKSAQ